MSTHNEKRIFVVQILIDSLNIYNNENTNNYDKDFTNVKIILSKFLNQPRIELGHGEYSAYSENEITEVQINEGKSLMFSLSTDNIANVFRSALIELDIHLESNNEVDVKLDSGNINLGHSTINVANEMLTLLKFVNSVSNDNPVITEKEGSFEIIQNYQQIGTIFLGVRFTMFGKSIARPIGISNTTHSKSYNNMNKVCEDKNEDDYNENHDEDEVGEEYTHIYSELNGQIANMKIKYEPAIKLCPKIKIKNNNSNGDDKNNQYKFKTLPLE